MKRKGSMMKLPQPPTALEWLFMDTLAEQTRRHLLGMQPSIWCGGTPNLTPNVGFALNIYAPCWTNFGLGCQQWSGARRLQQVEHLSRHLQADTDPFYQEQILGSIDYLANY